MSPTDTTEADTGLRPGWRLAPVPTCADVDGCKRQEGSGKTLSASPAPVMPTGATRFGLDERDETGAHQFLVVYEDHPHLVSSSEVPAWPPEPQPAPRRVGVDHPPRTASVQYPGQPQEAGPRLSGAPISSAATAHHNRRRVWRPGQAPLRVVSRVGHHQSAQSLDPAERRRHVGTHHAGDRAIAVWQVSLASWPGSGTG